LNTLRLANAQLQAASREGSGQCRTSTMHSQRVVMGTVSGQLGGALTGCLAGWASEGESQATCYAVGMSFVSYVTRFTGVLVRLRP